MIQPTAYTPGSGSPSAASTRPAPVREHEVALVERHVGQRHGLVADGAQDEPALDRLDRRVEGRARSAPSSPRTISLRRTSIASTRPWPRISTGERRKRSVIRRPASVRSGRGRELAQQPDVRARREGALLGQPGARHRIELDLARVDADVDAVETAQLAQLGAGERGLRRPAAAEHHDLLDRARAQRLQRVVGDVRPRELRSLRVSIRVTSAATLPLPITTARRADRSNSSPR